MEADSRQVADHQLPAKLGAEGVRRPGPAAGPDDDQVVVIVARGRSALPGLTAAMAGEFAGQ